MSRATALATSLADLLGGLRVLHRERLLEPARLDRTLRSARETTRLGPVTTAVRVGRRRHPEAVAVLDGTGATTYADLDRRAAALAHHLLSLAPAPATPPVVGLLARDHGGAVVTLAACGYAGSRVVLLNTGAAAPQLAGVLESEGVDVVAHDAELAPVVAAAWPRGPRLTVDALPTSAAVAPPPFPRRSGGLVVLTSGTTGPPKGAPRPRVNPLQAAQVVDRLPFPARSTVVMAAPIFHGTGLSQTCLALSAGCQVVLPGRFDADRVADLVAATEADLLVAVPTMLHRLLALPNAARRLGSLSRIYVGGSALSPVLSERTRELLGPVLFNLYGSTEVGVAAVAGPSDLALAPGCVGRPPVATHLSVLGPDRRPVPHGEVGTLFVRSPLTFTGYSDGSAKERIDGAVSTGDLARYDDHGLLHVVGREDDMVVSGGENVAPGRVEDLLATHPDVDEVVVVGVPDEEFGQRLRAAVVATPGAVPDPEALRDLARRRLARHEVPREVWVVEALPRNAMGKVVRRVVSAARTAHDLHA